MGRLGVLDGILAMVPDVLWMPWFRAILACNRKAVTDLARN